MYLQECGDGQGGDAAVTVRDEVLQIHIAGGDSVRMDHSNAVQGLHSREPDGGLGRGQEHLEHRTTWTECA